MQHADIRLETSSGVHCVQHVRRLVELRRIWTRDSQEALLPLQGAPLPPHLCHMLECQLMLHGVRILLTFR